MLSTRITLASIVALLAVHSTFYGVEARPTNPNANNNGGANGLRTVCNKVNAAGQCISQFVVDNTGAIVGTAAAIGVHTAISPALNAMHPTVGPMAANAVSAVVLKGTQASVNAYKNKNKNVPDQSNNQL
ncbi:hypothetical protein BDF22DRAFT_702056 [Syncephalis plumigaleata]|nr:hypothetical protein BDF22DRAFT_702056 [Syncephalis plumigaleata]